MRSVDPAPDPPHRAAAFLSGALLVGISLLVTLGGIELGLRLFWTGYFVKDAEPYAEPHPTRGWTNRPGIRVTYGEAEFHKVVTHDSRGFRSPEVETRKPAGRIRVLVLGDSFTWGVGVEDDETFSARLQAADPRLEVINTGTNGYGTSQELRLLLEEGLALEPDLVLVAFFWNDVPNSFKRPLPAYALRDGQLHYEPPAIAAGPPDERPEAPLRRRFLRWSYTYRFVSDRLKLLRYHLKTALGQPLEESEFVSEADLKAAWQLEFALLREIDRLSRAQGARCAIAILPEQLQVEPEVPVIGLDERDYAVQEPLRAFGAREGIPVIDLLPALREEYRTSREALYYRWDRHLNARGHALVARELLRALRELALLPPAAGGSTG